MRETVLFVEGWLFHAGELERKPPATKLPIYRTAKTERAIWGPAAAVYDDLSDRNRFNGEVCIDKWEPVDLPHDFVISGEFDEARQCFL